MNTSSSSVWFVTGTSSGLGLALARHALRRGYRVVATAWEKVALDTGF